jgi:hypothetical protein
MLSVQFIIFSTAGLGLRYPYRGNDPVPKTFKKCEVLIIFYRDPIYGTLSSNLEVGVSSRI